MYIKIQRINSINYEFMTQRLTHYTTYETLRDIGYFQFDNFYIYISATF